MSNMSSKRPRSLSSDEYAPKLESTMPGLNGSEKDSISMSRSKIRIQRSVSSNYSPLTNWMRFVVALRRGHSMTNPFTSQPHMNGESRSHRLISGSMAYPLGYGTTYGFSSTTFRTISRTSSCLITSDYGWMLYA
jgi:hypothetical protein